MRGQGYHPMFNCPWYNAINLYSKKALEWDHWIYFRVLKLLLIRGCFFWIVHMQRTVHTWKGLSVIHWSAINDSLWGHPPLIKKMCLIYSQTIYFADRHIASFFLAGGRGPSLPVRHLVVNAAVMSFFVSRCHCSSCALGFTQKY